MNGQVEAVLAASRVLVAVSSESLSAVDDVLGLVQFRVLVILASRGPMDLNALAKRMGVHPSNATRACDKLVGLGFVERGEDPSDRRRLLLAPSAAGVDLLESVSEHRRDAIRQVVAKMTPQSRRHLEQVMTDFAAAGDELPTDQWSGLLT
ncbi:MAG: MarR family winged helix-turn-helix transcriptional regulator [Jatrophihabitantaceae bacterium]